MLNKLPLVKKEVFGMILAGGVLVATGLTQTAQANGKSTTAAAATASTPATPTHKVSPYRPGLPSNAKEMYQLNWGVDNLGVRSVESGMMIRFSYRVVNADKAQVLNDKKAAPFLVDEKTHAKLVVPTMEKVGQLRQSGAPEVGKAYWMVFSNKGNFVKRGDPVTVVIGKFRADGLVVE